MISMGHPSAGRGDGGARIREFHCVPIVFGVFHGDCFTVTELQNLLGDLLGRLYDRRALHVRGARGMQAQKRIWSVVKSEPQREALALHHLRNQNVTTYMPIMFNDRNKRREPLFPSYLFVQLVRGGPWAFINNTRGVSYVITMQGEPSPLPNAFVKAIRQTENRNGVIMLPEQKELEEHDRLLVTEGPFKGHSAEFARYAGPKRVEMLLTFLGTVQKVTVPRSSVTRLQ